MRSSRGPVLLALLGAVLVAACEPASITEARNQLRRGGSRVFSITMPVSEDSVVVDVGGKLQFSNLALDPYNYSFNQMLQTTQQTASFTFPVAPLVSGVD